MSQNSEISTSFSFQDHTILIIDDEPTNLKLMASFLQGLGFTIVTAQEGESGLVRASSDQPDLILLDVLMPTVDGFEVCCRLKEDKTTQDIPVIFVTVATDLQEKIKGFKVGAVDYITKPLHQEEVLARVVTHLRLRDLNRELHQELTRRKQAEQALHESEALFRATFEEASMGICLTDMQGGILTANLAFQKMFGYSATELREMTNLDLTHPDDINQSKMLLQELVNGKSQSYQIEKRYRCKNSQVVWGRLAASLVRDDQERPLFVIGMIEDITERKQAEESLRRSEAIQGAVLDAISDFMFWTNQNGDFIPFNALTHATLPEAGEPAKKLVDALPPEVARQILAHIDQIYQTGELQSFEYSLSLPDEIRYYEARLVSSGLDEIPCILRDITERKQAEETLAKERNLMRTLIDNLPDLIYVKDTDSRLLLVNNASLMNEALTMEDLIGKTDFDLHPPELAAQYYADDQAVIRSGQPISDREEPNTGSGQLLWFSTTKVPLRDAQGQITGLVGVSRDITKRKQMEAVLAQERNLLRAFIDHIPDLMYVKDTQSRFMIANRAVAELMGVSSPAELIGKTDFDFLPEAMAAEFYHEEQALINSGSPRINAEGSALNRSLNQERWFLSTKVPFPDSAGNIVGLIGLDRDITENKQMETTLAEERNLLRTLIDTLPDSIYVKDTAGRHLLVNHATTQGTYVTTREELMGKTDLDLYPPELAQQWYADDMTVIQSGQPVINREEPSLDEAGGKNWDLTTKVPLRDSQGQVIGLVGVTRDITERKRMEEALRQSEERFALAVDGSNDGIWDHDLVNNTLYWSPRVFELYGFDPHEIDETFDKFEARLHPDDKEPVKRAIEAHLKDRVPYDMEQRARVKSGEYRWFRNRGQAVWDEAGRPVRMVGSSTDVTERKQMEEALRASETRMQRVVKATTEAIWDWDLITDELTWSEGFCQLFGYPPDKIGANSAWWYDHIHPDDVTEVATGIQAIIDSGQELWQAEYRFWRFDGSYATVSDRGYVSYDPAGRAVQMSGGMVDITMRKQMEAALAEERNLLHTVINATPDWIFIKDQNHRFRLVNQAYASLFDLSPDYLVGKTDLDLGIPEDIVKGNPEKGIRGFWPDDCEVMESGEVKYIAEEPAVINGQALTLSTVKVPLKDITGNVWGVLGFVHDITGLKRVEEALIEERNLLRTLIDNLPDSVYVKDRAGRHLLANYRLLDGIGIAIQEELVGKTDLELYPPEVAQRWYADDMAVIQSGQPLLNHEEFSLDETRGICWFMTTKVPLYDSHGQVMGLVGVTRDITEQKQMEETLRQSEERFALAVHGSNDGIWDHDMVNNTLYWSPRLFELYGFDPNEPDSSFDKYGSRIHPDDEEQVKATIAAHLKDRVPYDLEQRALTKSGEYRWFRNRGQAVWDEMGRPLRMVGSTIDVTDQKRAAVELQQAKEVAESAARAKSEFLANMSHEIRTPLNAIIGMTSLLLDTPISLEQRDFAETIRTSGDALLTLINDILDFSKIEAGKLELEKQPFDLRQCIEESLDLVSIKASEKHLDLAYLIDDATPNILVGDVTRLRQILVNLLSNAVKFTEQGEIVLSVLCRQFNNGPTGEMSATGSAQSPSLRYGLHFAVRDTGLGIPPDRMDRLFRSFSQVDASTTRKFGGTGLGLTISKRLTEMMGGRMWVESEGIPGQGSKFQFTLLAEAAASQPRVLLYGKQPELTGKQLLIVDDNATNRLILARQAQSWGMRARAAVSGEEALAWISRGDAFDQAILDMQMPDMDGLTLAKEIRKYRSPQTLPLIMLTSLGQRENNDLISQVEFAAYLTKPIKSSHLYNTLLGVIAGQLVKVHPASTPSSMLNPKLGHDHPLHILLAEDNAVNQKVALQLLKRMGYLADIAANGLEVLQALKRQPYNVILMDMQMPEMDGLEATRCIHEQWPAEQRPWIVAMTANALQGDRERCLEAGMDDYVSKPVRPEELAQALLRYQPRSGQNEARAFTQTINPIPVEDKGGDHQIHQNGQVLEAKVLAELYDLLGDQAPQILGELVDLYLGTATSLLEAMRTAIEKEDARALYQAAHTLKPSSAHLGAIHLSNLCKELEAIGHAGQLEEAAVKLTELEAEFGGVMIALEAEKEKNNG